MRKGEELYESINWLPHLSQDPLKTMQSTIYTESILENKLFYRIHEVHTLILWFGFKREYWIFFYSSNEEFETISTSSAGKSLGPFLST